MPIKENCQKKLEKNPQKFQSFKRFRTNLLSAMVVFFYSLLCALTYNDFTFLVVEKYSKEVKMVRRMLEEVSRIGAHFFHW